MPGNENMGDWHPQIGSMDSLATDFTKSKKLQNLRVTERQTSEVQEKEEQEERNCSATADEINESLGHDDNVVITMTADSEDDYDPTRSLRKLKKSLMNAFHQITISWHSVASTL